jgi:hypothetical protein
MKGKNTIIGRILTFSSPESTPLEIAIKTSIKARTQTLYYIIIGFENQDS